MITEFTNFEDLKESGFMRESIEFFNKYFNKEATYNYHIREDGKALTITILLDDEERFR